MGSYEHEEIDAQTFADWGIDFVEEDSCHHPAYPNGTLIPYEILYGRMRDALNATGRPIIFYSCVQVNISEARRKCEKVSRAAFSNFLPSLVQGQENVSLAWGTQMANLWRTTGDICAPMHATWSGVINNFRGNAKYPQISGPGHWQVSVPAQQSTDFSILRCAFKPELDSLLTLSQDPDMLVVGMDGLSALEWRTHFSLWAMSAAPLWIGIDVPSMGAEARAILLNTDVIAVDQDPLGHAATQRNATTTVMDRQPGVADNTAVTLQACATAPSWVYTRANGSLSTLNVCATIESCSVAAGGSVIFYDCVGQQGGCPANQGFALVPGPGSGALLIRANISGMCLTSHGAGQAVDQQPCDTTSANQLWQFQGDGRITWAPSSAQLCLGVATQPGEVWARPLQQSPNGSFRGAALFFNPDDSQNVTITASRSALGVPSAAKVVAVTDLWSKQTFELGPSLTSRLLAPHDSMMVVLQELA